MTYFDYFCPECNRWIAKLDFQIPNGKSMKLRCKNCRKDVIFYGGMVIDHEEGEKGREERRQKGREEVVDKDSA